MNDIELAQQGLRRDAAHLAPHIVGLAVVVLGVALIYAAQRWLALPDAFALPALVLVALSPMIVHGRTRLRAERRRVRVLREAMAWDATDDAAHVIAVRDRTAQQPEVMRLFWGRSGPHEVTLERRIWGPWLSYQLITREADRDDGQGLVVTMIDERDDTETLRARFQEHLSRCDAQSTGDRPS